MRGCVLPRFPAGGESLTCQYKDEVQVVCRLRCQGEERERTSHCHTHHGQWRGDQRCRPLRPAGRLAECRHRRLQGCLVPGALQDSQVHCRVTRTETRCRVVCGAGLVSPSHEAACSLDTSGWEGRWSRLLLPCRPHCQASLPEVRSGQLRCEAQQEDDDGLHCELSCLPGHSPSAGTVTTCSRGVWSLTGHCVPHNISGPHN